MWTYNYNCSNELYHHGILGMKWGVRRYQNSDGSLTSAGRKRYSENVDRAKAIIKDKQRAYNIANAEYNKAYNKYAFIPTKKNYDEMKKARDESNKAKKDLKMSKVDYQVEKRREDGNLHSANKSNHQKTLEEKFKKQGYTRDQAAVMAKNRIKTERVVAGAAALTLTACAAYAANKYIKNRTDQIISSDDILQRIEMQDTGGKLHDVFYVSKGEHDNKRYKDVLDYTRKQQTGEAYIMKFKSNGSIKVASNDKAAKVFGELYKNDPEFRDSVKDTVSEHFGGSNKIKNINDLSNRNIRKMYENFNSGIVNIREGGSGADKKFYNKLKEAGYGAIQDINDMKYSGYNAKNPLIVFDNSKNNIMIESVSKLDVKNKDYTKEVAKSSIESLVKDLLGTTGVIYVSDTKTTKSKGKKV